MTGLQAPTIGIFLSPFYSRDGHDPIFIDNYINNNFNTIKSYRKLNDNNYEVESMCSDESYNRGHIGCAILSMSNVLDS